MVENNNKKKKENKNKNIQITRIEVYRIHYQCDDTFKLKFLTAYGC